MSKPLVLVTADVKSIDGSTWHAALATYIEAVLTGADAIPVVLPSLGTKLDLDAVLDHADGLLVTGSPSNVGPDLYGGERTEANGPYDPDRDATTLPLIRKAVARGIPVFAICRGIQELNVAFGGTLLREVQTLPGRNDHRHPQAATTSDERYVITHSVDVVPDGELKGILGEGTIRVNSLHRQAVGNLAPDLKIEARAEDGTIEAVSLPCAAGFVLATQWHPEYWIASDTPSQKIFAAFGKAVRDYVSERDHEVATTA